MEEGSQESIQVISDTENKIEKYFQWTFEGLKMMGFINKNTSPMIKSVMMETFKKYTETEVETLEKNLLEKSEILEGNLQPSETEEARFEDRRLTGNLECKNEENTETPEMNQDQGKVNNDISGKALPKISEEILAIPESEECTGSSTAISAVNLKTEISSFVQETETWASNNAITSVQQAILRELEDGEISCSTETTGEPDEENMIGNVNQVLKSLKENEGRNPNLKEKLFRSHLKICTVEDVPLFVDRVFKGCLESTKFSIKLSDLIVESQALNKDIYSQMIISVWNSCFKQFDMDSQEESFELSYSENSIDMAKLFHRTKENLATTTKLDNVIFLICLFVERRLADHTKLVAIIYHLLDLATNKSTRFLRYLCSLLSQVGNNLEARLRQSHAMILIQIKHDVFKQATTIMDEIFDGLLQLKNSGTLNKGLEEEIQNLILQRNNWVKFDQIPPYEESVCHSAASEISDLSAASRAKILAAWKRRQSYKQMKHSPGKSAPGTHKNKLGNDQQNKTIKRKPVFTRNYIIQQHRKLNMKYQSLNKREQDLERKQFLLNEMHILNARLNENKSADALQPHRSRQNVQDIRKLRNQNPNQPRNAPLPRKRPRRSNQWWKRQKNVQSADK